MMLQPPYRIVLSQPVAMLDLRRRRVSRQVRRSHRYGKQTRWDKVAGVLSPKQMRESGL